MMKAKFGFLALAVLIAGGCATQPPPNTTAQKIPILGDIPVLGGLFRYEAVSAADASQRQSVSELTDWTGSYTVRAGDSLAKIAARHAVTVADIRGNNDLRSDKIRVGQKLRVPGGSQTQSEPPPAETASQRGGGPLPAMHWPPENIAVAELTPFTLSQGEAKTLTEKLHTTLVETKYFNVLSRSDMKAVLDAQQFQRSDACDDSACLVEMGKLLAVQNIIGGSVGKVGTTFSLSLRLVNVETGKTELTADRQLRAEPDQLLDLVQEAGQELALRYAQTKQR